MPCATRPTRPGWSYALTWTLGDRAAGFGKSASQIQAHCGCGWFCIAGLAGKNGDLRGWMDSTFYPASAEWGEEDAFLRFVWQAAAKLADGRPERRGLGRL